MCIMSRSTYPTKSIKIKNKNWWKKGNNSKMGNQIYFKIAGYVDLDVLIIFTPCQIFDIINGFWVISISRSTHPAILK
jgi:hypothetical protein